jgi:hypothetical protein
MYSNIPLELRELNQWVCWRLEFEAPMLKPTKVPYTPRPNCGMANVMKPETWGTFEQATGAPLNCVEPAKPGTPVSQTGFTGIGFVFTKNDPYAGVDCDDCKGDADIYEFQREIYNRCNSYAEYSPSGNGIHIIVKATVPTGRRRNFVEIYPHARFFTMTGNVFNNAPIRDCQKVIDEVYNKMAKDIKPLIEVEPDKEQSVEDEDVINRGKSAVNGEKFTDLWEGNWQKYYPSQSEADFALIDMLAFYTKYIPQIRRLFRMSMLGQRDKANRDDYLDYMVEKAFDRQLPPVDISNLAQIVGDNLRADVANAVAGAKAPEPGKAEAVAATATATSLGQTQALVGRPVMPERPELVNIFPPGILGEIAQYFYSVAPRPAEDLALAGAIAYLAGVTGRSYNISGTGLNQYILMLAPTGVGKDAVASGISKLNAAILPTCPSIIDFKGPGELVSAPGLIKWFTDKKKSFVCVLGEFGKKMKEMSGPHANAHLIGLSRVILQMYSKSGAGEVFDPMAYSDKDKNTASLRAPALTIFGESVPDSFYESLDESMIGDGLLPRFMVFESNGHRPYLNKNQNLLPPIGLTSRMNDLAAHCLALNSRDVAQDVEIARDAEEKLDEYDIWTTDQINGVNADVIRHLWNRAHLKAMKLAALRAVGENYLKPVITLEQAMWAIEMTNQQTTRLIAKFETGQVGSGVNSGEIKQIAEVIKTMREFVTDHEKFVKYGGRLDMIQKEVIPHSIISRKVNCLAAFRNDRMGQKFALKRAIDTLLEADDIREVGSKQMMEMFGSKPKAYVIANNKRFTEDLFDK